MPVQELQEMWAGSLGWEDPLEEDMATSAVFLPEESRGAWWATVHMVAKSQARLK